MRVLSAPARRCLDTVGPLAAACGLPIEVEPALGEQAYADDPAGALPRLRELSGGDGRWWSEPGAVVPGLVRAVADGTGVFVGTGTARKGSTWALSFAGGRLVDADHLGPLA